MKNRAFLCDLMRDFDNFYAQFLYGNQNRNNICENSRIFPQKYARFFNLMSEIAHRAALTLSLMLSIKVMHIPHSIEIYFIILIPDMN